jgi:hypothetical protein
MKANLYSYRFAQEILQHEKYKEAWHEVIGIVETSPVYIFPGKSKNNPDLNVVQQLQNTYFDRRFAIDYQWQHHPLATNIKGSSLKADFRKQFNDLTIQVEVQFGNAARWYSDIFKFQAAYSQKLIQLGLSILPMSRLGKRIDSNIVSFERAKKELPSAELSITLPILLIGLEVDESTQTINVGQSKFKDLKQLTGKNNSENLWRIVNGLILGNQIDEIGPESEIGQTIKSTDLTIDGGEESEVVS